jgi:catechol 2,3-dioxygenase-like lactoylglutathione lyase family enzyme
MPVHSLAPLSVTHLNLDVADLTVSERFYRDELCLPVERRPASLAIRTPAFLLVLAQGRPQAGGSFHFGFRVAAPADVDAWFDRFRQRGVSIVESPVERGDVYVGRLRDPDDYPIEVYSERR